MDVDILLSLGGIASVFLGSVLVFIESMVG